MVDAHYSLSAPTEVQQQWALNTDANAQIKLLEIWKSQHSETYPIKWISLNESAQDRRTSGSSENLLKETFGCQILNSTFINDSARIWNLVPEFIKSSVTLSSNMLYGYC